MGCMIDGCARTHHSQGLCDTHYRAWKQGRINHIPPPARTCTVDGCTRRHYAHGWCRNHYLTRWRAANLRQPCDGDDCTNTVPTGGGYCRTCQKQNRRRSYHQVQTVDWLWVPDQPTPCYGNPHLWENPRQFEAAAAGCAECPAAKECAAYAGLIRPWAGTWGGVWWSQGSPLRKGAV